MSSGLQSNQIESVAGLLERVTHVNKSWALCSRVSAGASAWIITLSDGRDEAFEVEMTAEAIKRHRDGVDESMAWSEYFDQITLAWQQDTIAIVQRDGRSVEVELEGSDSRATQVPHKFKFKLSALSAGDARKRNLDLFFEMLSLARKAAGSSVQSEEMGSLGRGRRDNYIVEENKRLKDENSQLRNELRAKELQTANLGANTGAVAKKKVLKRPGNASIVNPRVRATKKATGAVFADDGSDDNEDE